MSVGLICTRSVDLADAEETIQAAAQRMDERNVGTLVILNPAKEPSGILTDRDLVIRALSHDRSPRGTQVSAVMTRNPRTIPEAAPVERALSLMRSVGCRRLPVVGVDGTLVGLVSLDDILSLMAEEFAQVGSLVEKEMWSGTGRTGLRGRSDHSQAEELFSGPSTGRERRDGARPMRAGELMRHPVVTVGPETCLSEVARTMVDRRIGAVPVVNPQGKLCGIVTETDFAAKERGMPFSILRLAQVFSEPLPGEAIERVHREARTTAAKEVMITELITATEETPVDEVARLMLCYDIDHVPVVRDGALVGIISRHDFLRMTVAAPKPK
jgi:CBS domain-containing protein